MRHEPSAAWLELGNQVPEERVLNVEALAARERDRREHLARKAAQAAVPPRRAVVKGLFAQLHAALDEVEAVGLVFHGS